MIIEVTMRDLYMTGTDTVILEGNIADRYRKSSDKSRFLANLETVAFESPYAIKDRTIKV